MNPFELRASSVTMAYLTGKVCGLPQNIRLAVSNGTGAAQGVAMLSLADGVTLPKGVYQLHVQAQCGCFTLKVYSDCPTPSTTDSQYHPTVNANGSTLVNGTPEPVPSC
jgi:hypothetical protein